MEFKYNLADVEDIDYAISKNLSLIEKIEISEAEKGLAISANKAGWLALARMCVEMASISERDPDFHIHKGKNFQPSFDSEKDAISFFFISEDK